MPVGAAHGNDEPRWSTACGSTSLRSVAVAMETNGHVLQTGEARALLQYREPQELWRVYRAAQRRLEYELARYDHGTSQHESTDKEQRDRALVARTVELSEAAHDAWEPLVPSLSSAQQPGTPELKVIAGR